MDVNICLPRHNHLWAIPRRLYSDQRPWSQLPKNPYWVRGVCGLHISMIFNVWSMFLPNWIFSGFNVGEIHQPHWAFGITYSIGSIYVFFTVNVGRYIPVPYMDPMGIVPWHLDEQKWSESHHPFFLAKNIGWQMQMRCSDGRATKSHGHVLGLKNGGSWQSGALLLHFEIEQWKNPGCLVYIGD